MRKEKAVVEEGQSSTNQARVNLVNYPITPSVQQKNPVSHTNPVLVPVQSHATSSNATSSQTLRA